MSSPLTTDAVSLLQKVKAHILEEPKRLDMFYWNYNSEWAKKEYDRYLEFPRLPTDCDCKSLKATVDDPPSCNTVGCIAGWTCVLSGIPTSGNNNGELLHTAGQLLGLDRLQKQDLFYLWAWPEPFKNRYHDVLNQAVIDRNELAKITAERIEHFIATGE